jgi:serine/threonine protein kinase
MWNQLSKYYDISYQIGQGSFGSVYLAYKKGTLEKVAIKVLVINWV